MRCNLGRVAKEIIKPLFQRCAIARGWSKGPFADDTREITRGSHQLCNGHTTRGQRIRSVGHHARSARVFACLKRIPRGIAQRIAALKTRVAALEPVDLRMGAASFAMTGLIAMVSLPVAAAVSVVHLMRGPDFRLTTQALSVTALFVGVESSVGLNTLMNIIH